MLEKRYHPAQYEAQIYRKWEQSGAFKPSEVADGREAYTIVIPPPNITGNLHMGHALNNMVQDVLIRSKRMQGYDVLWQPGIDHASIATQMVVERQLAEQGLPDRRSMGREAFLERVWQWKAISGGRIADQLRRLGASCDWSRERFTMDAMLGRAVVEMFVRLHEQGLIYRAKRMLNWDPKMETAISDLEVVQREVQGTLWRFAYPIKDDREGARIPVATTRPETMLGDVAVAVNPHDPRYLHLIGRSCVQPVTGRELIIIADDHADPEAGTGAVKITPAHDFNDFEVGKRHGLELVEIFDHHACLNENVPPAYQGLDRMKARTKIIADMQALGAFLGEDAITHSVPYGERGGVPVEPMVTDQWFVDCTSLAARAIESVKAGRTEFVPVGWDQNFFNWLEQIEPWCISRQLWWGHQIPAWYGPDGQVFVGRDLAEAAKKAEAAYGEKVKLVRDPDVLDTWFSSALWPFSTQGWPDKTEDFQRFYPTSVLVTGFDIIFFWVARMMMAGLHLTDREPFHTVYVHALVRDEHGQKMSKSKGNVIDPLSVIDRYGADALRMTLCALAAPGRDMRLSVDRVADYRNFLTKLWNGCRFAELHEVTARTRLPARVEDPVNQWVLAKLAGTTRACNRALSAYRFHDLAAALYQFVWHDFCDWYLECAKLVFYDGNDSRSDELRHVMGYVLQHILRLLHPVTPFVTEKLWQDWGKFDQALIGSAWPLAAELEQAGPFIKADDVDRVWGAISAVRSVRSQLGVPVKARPDLIVIGEAGWELADEYGWLVCALAGLGSLAHGAERPKGSAGLVIDGCDCALAVKGIIDIAQERARLGKAIDKARQERDKRQRKLDNPNFMARAPAEEIAKVRSSLEACELDLASLQKAFSSLPSSDH